MTKTKTLFFSICVIAFIIFHASESFGYTDAELTAKYHDMESIQSALDSGELKCVDLPDNIKSASCTDDARKVVLPDGSTQPPPINAGTVWTITVIIAVVMIIPIGVKIYLASRDYPSSYYDDDEKPKKKKYQISLIHSILLKIGLAHQIKKSYNEDDYNPISSDLSGIESHVDTDKVFHTDEDYRTLNKTKTKKSDLKLSPFQNILVSIGILKVQK